MKLRRALRIPLVAILLAGSALGIQGSSGGHRARLSADLLTHEARHTATRVRIIVHGTADEVSALAERHRVRVLHQLEDSAVLAVNSTELSDLAADPTVDHVSPDLRV